MEGSCLKEGPKRAGNGPAAKLVPHPGDVPQGLAAAYQMGAGRQVQVMAWWQAAFPRHGHGWQLSFPSLFSPFFPHRPLLLLSSGQRVPLVHVDNLDTRLVLGEFLTLADAEELVLEGHDGSGKTLHDNPKERIASGTVESVSSALKATVKRFSRSSSNKSDAPPPPAMFVHCEWLFGIKAARLRLVVEEQRPAPCDTASAIVCFHYPTGPNGNNAQANGAAVRS